MRDYNIYKTQCEYSGELFSLTCDLGYDSIYFIKTFLLSEWGDYYYSDDCYCAWLSVRYVLEDLEDKFVFKKGITLSRDFMYWFGYLLRFWTINYTDTISEILEMHTIEDWLNSYDGLHVMPWEDVVEYMRINDNPIIERK